MPKAILIIALICCSIVAAGQEFRCNVSVSSSRVEGTYKQVFESMRTDIYEFMNNRKWSDNVFTRTKELSVLFLSRLPNRFRPMSSKGPCRFS